MSKKRPNSAAAVAADRFRPGAFFLPGLVLFLFTALTTINAIKIPALLALSAKIRLDEVGAARNTILRYTFA